MPRDFSALAKKKVDFTRFKRGQQGVIELACVIEQADPRMKKKIMEETRAQEPALFADVMRRVVFFDELVYLDEGILAEILSTIPSKILAYALRPVSEEFRATMLRQMGFRDVRKLKDEEEKLSQQVDTGLIRGAQNHVLRSARKLEAQAKFVFQLENCPRFKEKKRAA